MKILFFVPTHTDAVDINHEFTTHLAQSISEMADVRIATSSEKNIASLLSDYDLLHIFGCWSNCACMLADKAYRLRVPYVVTLLGGLQPWEMARHHNQLMLRRQRRVVERATAVSVCGKLEDKTFSKLGWNKRVSLIKNPVLTSQTTFEAVALEFSGLYRKSLDSNARLLIKKEAREAIGQLLQLGVDENLFVKSHDKAALTQTLDNLTADDWRYIFIYAADENITEILYTALQTLQYQYPQVDVEAIDRFDNNKMYQDGHLKDDGLLSRNILLKNKVKEAGNGKGEAELAFCLMLMNFQYEVHHRSAPLMHLIDIYHAMRYMDMDEDMVMEMSKELGIDDFAERLTGALNQFMGLTEGFQLFTPKSGGKTSTLLKEITKFGVYK